MALYPYQGVGRDWLAPKKVALLADDMGLGKTPQAIAGADLARCGRVLVLCPAVARINWEREFRKFSDVGRRFAVCLSGADDPGDASTICSYDLAVRFHANGRWRGVYDLAILDEVHFLKSLDAKRTRAIFGKSGLVRRCGRVWALTGTPMPNGDPAELWVLLYTFGATKLNFRQFITKFCTFSPGSSPEDYKPRTSGLRREATAELVALLKPIMLRRRKKDVELQLPPITLCDVIVERRDFNLREHQSFFKYLFPDDKTEMLLDEMLKMQSRVETEMEALGGKQHGTRNFMLMLEAMSESVSTLRRYTGIQKLPAVGDMLEWELSNDYYDKVVVFAIHRDVIESLRSRFAKEYGAVSLYGGTDPVTRQKNIDKFQNDPKCRMIVCNIKAAGTAVTLTAANQVVFIEQEWTPADNAQAAMRCHRIGQKRHVMCRFVGLADSYDERVSNILRKKTRDIVAVFDGADGNDPDEFESI